jgi:hypothetical protein
MDSQITAVDEFLRKQGLERIEFHGTDYSWGFRENEPVIALIAKGDGGAAFQAAMSLYWASAEYIVKPWCLFISVEDIAPHHRQMIENLSRQFNINMVPIDVLFESVEEQLDDLVKILEAYVPEGSIEPFIDLGKSVRSWGEEKPANEYSYNVTIEVGNLDVYKEGDELTPSRKTIPLTVTAGETKIDGVLPRLVKVDDSGCFFDTEHRNLPMVFRLFIGDSSRLVLRFEADKCNMIEATSFWSLYHGFLRTGRLAFIEPNTGDILFSCEGTG